VAAGDGGAAASKYLKPVLAVQFEMMPCLQQCAVHSKERTGTLSCRHGITLGARRHASFVKAAHVQKRMHTHKQGHMQIRIRMQHAHTAAGAAAPGGCVDVQASRRADARCEGCTLWGAATSGCNGARGF